MLTGEKPVVRDVMYGVYNGGTKPGMRCVKQGDWKLIQYDVMNGAVRETQLFNLKENPDELLAEHHDPKVTALTGVRGRDAYSASKGGVVSMTRSMAVHYAPQRIRVNAIAPTHTLTERSLERSKGRDVSSENSKNLLGPIQPIEVSSMAVYLASDESRVTTGQTFRLDSGFTIS